MMIMINDIQGLCQTSYYFIIFYSEVRINQQQPTLDCLRECLTFGDQCQAVTFKSNFHGYSPPCTIFNVPAGGSLTPPTMESNAAYFQKICIPGNIKIKDQ